MRILLHCTCRMCLFTMKIRTVTKFDWKGGPPPSNSIPCAVPLNLSPLIFIRELRTAAGQMLLLSSTPTQTLTRSVLRRNPFLTNCTGFAVTRFLSILCVNYVVSSLHGHVAERRAFSAADFNLSARVFHHRLRWVTSRREDTAVYMNGWLLLDTCRFHRGAGWFLVFFEL